MATVKIDFDDTRNRIQQCVTEGLRRIDSGEDVGGTSLGIELNSRFGRFILALNDDDDTSFRCDEIASYTRASWLGIDLPELESERIYEENDLEKEPSFVLIDQNDSKQEFKSYEDAVSAVFKWLVNYVREIFDKRSDDHWHPCYMNFLESETYEWTEVIHCLQLLPDAPRYSYEPIGGRRIQQLDQKGIEVYKVAYRPRKYASLTLADRSLYYSLPGKKPEGLALPLQAKLYRENMRVADLIPFFGGEFAIKQNDRNTTALSDYLRTHSDLLSVTDGEFEWLHVNCQVTADVLDNQTTKFDCNRIGARIEGIEFIEEALAKIDSPIFRIKGYEADGVYFMTKDGQGFLPLCEKNGYRGIDFDLVWTSEVDVLLPLIEQMFDLVYQRLDRLQGHHIVKRSKWADCLFGYQLELWRSCEFYLMNNKEGPLSAIRYLGGLDDVHLPIAVRFMRENKGATMEELAEHIGQRDLLKDFRGYLCRYLPKAIRQLKKMEENDSDHMACLGPTV